MATNFIEGNFYSIKDEPYVQALEKIGIPSSAANGLLNSHWYVKVRQVDDHFVCTWRCKEMPEMDSVMSFQEGVVSKVDCPLFGGKAKVLLSRRGSDTLHISAETEEFGLLEWLDEYTKEGIHSTMIVKECGLVFKELWPRESKFQGWYKFRAEENLKNFLEATACPPEMYSAMTNSMTRLEKLASEDVYVLTERFGKEVVENKFPLETECDYVMPGLATNWKLLFMEMGPGEVKMFMKSMEEEMNVEWNYRVDHNGAVWGGFHRESGQSCRIYMDKCAVNIYGDWKLTSVSGFENLGADIGMTPEFIAMVEADRAVMSITPMGRKLNHVKYDSKFTPVDQVVAFDEEFEMQYAGAAGTFTCIETFVGNTMVSVAKNSEKEGLTITKMTFGNDFLLQESWTDGKDLKTKAIFERV